jgi:hypothetical protein
MQKLSICVMSFQAYPSSTANYAPVKNAAGKVHMLLHVFAFIHQSQFWSIEGSIYNFALPPLQVPVSPIPTSILYSKSWTGLCETYFVFANICKFVDVNLSLVTGPTLLVSSIYPHQSRSSVRGMRWHCPNYCSRHSQLQILIPYHSDPTIKFPLESNIFRGIVLKP